MNSQIMVFLEQNPIGAFEEQKSYVLRVLKTSKNNGINTESLKEILIQRYPYQASVITDFK